jgi:hypothetical protein
MKGVVIVLALLLTVSFALPVQRFKRTTLTTTEETPQKDVVSKDESQEEKPVSSKQEKEEDAEESRRPQPMSPTEYGVYQYQYRTPPKYLAPVSQAQHPGPRPQYCCQHPVNCQRERPAQYFYPFPAYYPQTQPGYIRQPVQYIDDL